MISNIAVYLPVGRLTNEQLVKELGRWTPEEIFTKTGVRSRTIAAAGETAVDLAVGATIKLFDRMKSKEADFLLLCTQTPDYKLPSSSGLVQARAGLASSCGAFDINLACSGYIYGLMIGHSMIASGVASNVVLVNSDTYTHYIHPKDTICRPIFGDGAAATLLAATSKVMLTGFVFGSDGTEAMRMHIAAGGERLRHFRDAAETSAPSDPEFLKMDGPEIFNFTLRVVPAAVNDCLRKVGMTSDAVDYFVFHQANAFMLEALRRKINIPKEKFPVELEQTGNLVSASIPVVLEKMRIDGRLKPGIRTLLCGFGVGLSWGACLVTW